MSHVELQSGLGSIDRAGFWRRLIGFWLDGIIVAVPFQILSVLLYAASAGFVQDNSGVVFSNCQPLKKLSIPLDPAPPDQSNFTRECKYSFFGFETAHTLIVGRAIHEGNLTRTVYQSCYLGSDGHQIKAFQLDTIVFIVLFIYLVVLQKRTGATIGQRLLKIRVADRREPELYGISLRSAIIRNVALLLGFLPMLLILLVALIVGHGHADTMLDTTFFQWFVAAALFLPAWELWVCSQIVRREDAFHDRLAGTMVLRM